MKKITENNKNEFIGQIIDTFEDFLDEKGIIIPNPDRDNDPNIDAENAANIYGIDYGNLQTEFENQLSNWGFWENFDTDAAEERTSIPEYDQIDYDALACEIIDQFESDRMESGRKEIVRGMQQILSKHPTRQGLLIIDDVLMCFTGYTLSSLIEMSANQEYDEEEV